MIYYFREKLHVYGDRLFKLPELRHLKEHCDEKIVCLLLISIRNHLNIHLQDFQDFPLLKAVN